MNDIKEKDTKEPITTSNEDQKQSKLVPLMGTLSLGGEAEKVVTNAGVTTKDGEDIKVGTYNVSAVDDVADFQDKLMTGLGNFMKNQTTPVYEYILQEQHII